MNRNLFASAAPPRPADLVTNHAGGAAFAVDARAQLAQYVVTGTFQNTFYAKASDDLTRVVNMALEVDTPFLARLAVYGRERGHMKDAPALLLALLSGLDPVLFTRVFPRVVTDTKMLRNFVQAVRSGVTGRRSLGSGPKARVADWLNGASERALVNGTIGNDPSLADVIRLARPKPADAQREALYRWVIGKPVDAAALPALVRELEAFRQAPSETKVPGVEFRLVDQYLSKEQWKDVARTASWQMTRMNLNTFSRHGVFSDAELVRVVADRLADPAEVARSRVLPYQLLAAYRFAGADVPRRVLDALHAALDLAVANVPVLPGRVALFPDVSGSMRDPITGKGTATPSKVSCLDVAALMTASVLARNPDAIVIPFADEVREVKLSARDSVLTNAEKLAAVQGGGTAVSLPLRKLIEMGERVDAVIYASDNESWQDRDGAYTPKLDARGTSTATQVAWDRYKRISPDAKLVAIDVTPNTSVQARNALDTLNVGGFSDAVWAVIGAFLRGDTSGAGLVSAIEAVEL